MSVFLMCPTKLARTLAGVWVAGYSLKHSRVLSGNVTEENDTPPRNIILPFSAVPSGTKASWQGRSAQLGSNLISVFCSHGAGEFNYSIYHIQVGNQELVLFGSLWAFPGQYGIPYLSD